MFETEAIYERFDDSDHIESQTVSSSIHRSLIGGLAVVATVSLYALSGGAAILPVEISAQPQPPNELASTRLSQHQAEESYRNLISTITQVHDPSIDVCHDPYGSICGKFDKEYKLGKGVPIETWGFTKVEDEMARQSLVPLEMKCSDALASPDVDVWSSWMTCNFALCSQDGRYYNSKFKAPSSPLPLHNWAPSIDKVIRRFLPLVRLNSESLGQVSNSNPTEFKSFFSAYLGDLHNLGANTMFKINTTPDVLFSNGLYNLKLEGAQQLYKNKAQYSQEQDVKVLREYFTMLLRTHLTEVRGEPANDESTQARVEALIQFEKSLASLRLSESDKRDVIAINNAATAKTLMEGLDKVVDIDVFLVQQGAGHLGDILSDPSHPVVIDNPSYLERLNETIHNVDRTTLLDYLLVMSLDILAEHLSPTFRSAKAKFVTVSDGAPPSTDLNSSCHKWAADELPWIIGRDIINSAHDADIRRKLASEILTHVKDEFYKQVEDSAWMDSTTQQGAYKKLDAMSQQVGWPDWLKSDDTATGYDAYFRRFYLPDGVDRPDLPTLQAHLGDDDVEHKAAAFMEARLLLKMADHQELIGRLDQKIDLGIWSMYPQDVNAEYFTTTNNFMLPWGILQQPMMFPWREGPYESEEERVMNLALKAASYGGVGSVTSHEIMHGFDDDGRSHDYMGQLKPISSPASDRKFRDIITCIQDEYGAFEVKLADGDVRHVDGTMTQGENLADNGGLQTVSRMVLQGKSIFTEEEKKLRPLGKHGVQTEMSVLPLTMFATLWCEKATDDYLRAHLSTDPHSPGDKRITGVFSNLTILSDHLNCPVGSVMNPAPRQESEQNDLLKRNQCHIWN